MTTLELNKPSDSRWLDVLVYGKSGVGKTRFAGTATQSDETSPVLFIDAEAGVTTLQSAGFEPDVVRVEDFESFKKVSWFVHQHARLRQRYDEGEEKVLDNIRDLHEDTFGQIVEDPPLYRSVVVDSLSEIEDYLLSDITGDDRFEFTLEAPDPSWSDWRSNHANIRKMCRLFRDAPLHTVFTALVSRDKDKSGQVTIGPDLSGQLVGQIPQFFDVVGFMNVRDDDNGGVDRAIVVQPHKKFIAKDRTDAMDTVMVDPSVPQIYERKVNGKEEE